jgi:DnaJ-class molecular chaperone
MFGIIKYNLYEILNVPQDCDEKHIKKSYLKLIKRFHPDKNNILEEEIYLHIIYANQILSNKELRKKYDEFIKETSDFNKIKENCKKEIEQTKLNKTESFNNFHNKFNELNNMHGYSLNKIYTREKREEINIKKDINPKDIKEFNQIFLKNKTDKTMKDEIIEYKGEPMEISTFYIGDKYTLINDLEKLYIEDKNGNNSLNLVFKLRIIASFTAK